MQLNDRNRIRKAIYALVRNEHRLKLVKNQCWRIRNNCIAVNDRNRLTILNSLETSAGETYIIALNDGIVKLFMRSLETSGGAIVNDFQQNEMHCKLNPMGRKAAIFHSAWRYSGAETNRSIPAIAFQILNLSKPGKKLKA